MSGHIVLVDPAVHGVAADPEVLAYFIYCPGLQRRSQDHWYLVPGSYFPAPPNQTRRYRDLLIYGVVACKWRNQGLDCVCRVILIYGEETWKYQQRPVW